MKLAQKVGLKAPLPFLGERGEGELGICAQSKAMRLPHHPLTPDPSPPSGGEGGSNNYLRHYVTINTKQVRQGLLAIGFNHA